VLFQGLLAVGEGVAGLLPQGRQGTLLQTSGASGSGVKLPGGVQSAGENLLKQHFLCQPK